MIETIPILGGNRYGSFKFSVNCISSACLASFPMSRMG